MNLLEAANVESDENGDDDKKEDKIDEILKNTLKSRKAF